MKKQERNKKSEHQCPSLSPSFGNQSCFPKCLQLLPSHKHNSEQSTHPTHKGRCLWDKGTKPPMPLCPSRVKVNLYAQSSRWPRQLCPRPHQQESRGSLSTGNKSATPLRGKSGRALHWTKAMLPRHLCPCNTHSVTTICLE